MPFSMEQPGASSESDQFEQEVFGGDRKNAAEQLFSTIGGWENMIHAVTEPKDQEKLLGLIDHYKDLTDPKKMWIGNAEKVRNEQKEITTQQQRIAKEAEALLEQAFDNQGERKAA